MKTTEKYLDEVMQKHPKVRNDSQLAELIGVTRAAISQYRNGHAMSVAVALRVAKLLDQCPIKAVAATLFAQSRDEDEKRFWRFLHNIADVLKTDD